MEWLADNWMWVLLIGGFGAMHLFGHGRHGKGGGGCGGGSAKTADDTKDKTT